MRFHQGRLIDHVHLVVRDLEASRRFYAAVLETLGIPVGGSGAGWFFADELFVSAAQPDSGQPNTDQPPTGRVHLAFQARDRAAVHRFYQAALAAGGRDNGAPGERSYHPGYYAAFVLDPDGNNIEAVHHCPSRRSADAVVVVPAE